MRPSLWNREFTLLSAGLVISYVGDAFFAIGIIWLALTVSHNPLVIGSLMMVYGLPPLFLGPFAGALVDTWNKRRIMILADGLRAGIVLVMYVLYKADSLPLSLVYTAALLLSVCETLYKPALRVLVPTLVPDKVLMGANSFIQGSQQFAQILGAGLAGLVVVRLGTAATILVDALSFGISTIMLLLIRFPQQLANGKRIGARGVLQTAWEGIQYCFGHANLLRVIVLFFGMNLVLSPVNVIFPMYSQQAFGAGAQGFGWLTGAMSGGMLVGNLLVGLFGKRTLGTVSVAGGIFLMAAAFVILSLAPSLGVGIIGTALLGMAAPFIQVPMITDVQRDLPAAVQGRAFATIGTVSTASVPLGAAIAGFALSRWAPQRLFLAAATGMILVYFMTLLFRPAVGVSEAAADVDSGID